MLFILYKGFAFCYLKIEWLCWELNPGSPPFSNYFQIP